MPGLPGPLRSRPRLPSTVAARQAGGLLLLGVLIVVLAALGRARSSSPRDALVATHAVADLPATVPAPSAALPVVSPAQAPQPSVEQLLAEKFRPVLWLTAGDYRPADVRIVLGTESQPAEAALYRSRPGGGRELVDPAPTLAQLCRSAAADDQADYHLDLQVGEPRQAALGALDQAEYRDRYTTIRERFPATVYARVSATGGATILQYWFFYYFNDWANNHEGDWEQLTLLFAGDTPQRVWDDQDAPLAAGYSQHRAGTRRAWDAVERWSGTERPMVYVGRGSHANFFRPGTYRYRELAGLGEQGVERAGSDERLQDYALTLLPSQVTTRGRAACSETEALVEYGGRWGQPVTSACTIECGGPVGPAQQRSWQDPLGWLRALPDESTRWADCAVRGAATDTDCRLAAVEASPPVQR